MHWTLCHALDLIIFVCVDLLSLLTILPLMVVHALICYSRTGTYKFSPVRNVFCMKLVRIVQRLGHILLLFVFTVLCVLVAFGRGPCRR
jgi:hypothetical protein